MTRDRSGWIVGICTVMAAVGMFMATKDPALIFITTVSFMVPVIACLIPVMRPAGDD